MVYQLDENGLPLSRTADYVLGNRSMLGHEGFKTPITGVYTYHPRGVVFDNKNQRLFAMESTNTRVLVWDAAPARMKDGLEASIAIGQPDLNSNQRGVGRGLLSSVGGMALDEEND